LNAFRLPSTVRPVACACAVALGLLGGATWLAAHNLVGAGARVALSDRVRAAELSAETLFSTLKDAETGQRGFLLTGDISYLQPYDAARGRVEADLARLEAAPLGTGQRTARIARIRELTGEKFTELARTLALRRSGHADDALALVRTNRGKSVMDRIRVEVAALQSDAEATLAARQPEGSLIADWAGVAALTIAASALLAWALLEQERAAARHAESVGKLERFTRAFGLGLGMIRTSEGRITFWSQGSERLYGFTSVEAVGQVSHELLRTRFPRPLPELEASLAADGQWHGELVHKHRNGCELRVESHWLLHRGERAGDEAVIEVNSDLTILKQSDTLLQTIIESVPALILAMDRDGRIVLANKPVLGIMRRTASDVLGHTLVETLDNKVRAAAIMAGHGDLMREARGEQREEYFGHDAGGVRAWKALRAPMLNDAGTVIGLVSVSVEITTEKRNEEKLRQQAVDLSRSHEDLQQFSYIAAHDLKAPLRAICLLADWIAEDIKPTACAEAIDNLGQLHQRAARLGMLLDGLLSYSRVGHDKAPSEQVDIGTLISDITHSLAPSPGFTVRYSGPALVATTPRAPIEHVLRNLISNAIKHCDRPVNEIVVSARVTEGWTEFSVADDGPGIAPEFQERIFQIFQTLKNRDDLEASGVGLSIVKKTVERFGGKVWIVSAPPRRGTVFVFTWPQDGKAQSDFRAGAQQAAA
jgi:PAS domain S-box-containing protein